MFPAQVMGCERERYFAGGAVSDDTYSLSQRIFRGKGNDVMLKNYILSRNYRSV